MDNGFCERCHSQRSIKDNASSKNSRLRRRVHYPALFTINSVPFLTNLDRFSWLREGIVTRVGMVPLQYGISTPMTRPLVRTSLRCLAVLGDRHRFAVIESVTQQIRRHRFCQPTRHDDGPLVDRVLGVHCTRPIVREPIAKTVFVFGRHVRHRFDTVNRLYF